MEENKPIEDIVPGSSPKKSRKKWIGSLLIITVLIVVIVLGTTTNLFGGFRLIDNLPNGHFADDYNVSAKCAYKVNKDAYFCADGCHYYDEEYVCSGAVYNYGTGEVYDGTGQVN